MEQALCSYKITACPKTDMPVSKQTATFTPLFAAFRLLFALVLQAFMPASYYAAFNGCPFPLFCSLLATLCCFFLKYGYICAKLW